MKVTKKVLQLAEQNGALSSWVALNNYLRIADASECEKLLEREKSGKARRMFLLRIQSRLNRLNARAALEKLSKEVEP